ncbi:E3 ubiquitin-protein ligase TRIM39 isoform X2 [Danio rerio]|uniref:E3 ubiquitin-protein ligase TRIM39 isoform X2 n=1 Tax=Danio rerio TaxID=7955 RepID=A0AB32TTI7_DANRE
MAESLPSSSKLKRTRRQSIDQMCQSLSSSQGPLFEELQCSVCLDVFTDPVSTPCGHNFCKSCLNECWDKSQNCNCPICSETFSKRPKLKINTTLRQVVQLFKERLSKSEVQQMIQDRIKKIQDIKHSAELRKKSTEREKASTVGLFSDLLRSIEICQAELLEMIKEKQKAAEKQDEELIQELQQEINELKMSNSELDHLSSTEDNLQHLEINPSIGSPPHSRNGPEISVETLRRALTQLQETLDQKLSQTVELTMDPDTAHPELLLSDDRKQVRVQDVEHELPDIPERFDYCPDVLAKEGFSAGRFYFEVQVKGKTDWVVGVARESINRKGEITVNPQNGFWAVGLRNESEYKACTGPAVSLSLRVKPQKVGVFVDYEEGLVSFYDVESRSHIYSFIGQSFTEKVYPFFSPEVIEGGQNPPLIISPVIYND